MAFYWKDMSILEGGLELAGTAKSATLETSVEALDTTALSTTGWTTVVGGLKSGTVDISLMADGSHGFDLHAFDNLGVGSIPKSVTQSTDGSVAYLMQGITLNYAPVQGRVGELAMAQITGASSGVLVRGALIHPSNVSRTASSVGTGRELGAVAAGKKMYAALHVIAASGTSPTLDVIVQSDDNSGFTTPTTRITFSQKTGIGYGWGSVAGAVTDTHWRISYTIGGTGTPSFAFAVTAGVL